MCLEVGGVDHQPLGWAVLGRQGREDARKHAEPAPADEPVVERLGRLVAARCILPLQTVAEDADNAADHPAVIDTWQAARAREERLDAALLRHGQQDQVGHATPPTSSESHRVEPCKGS